MSKFKVGDTVYMGERKLTVEKVIDNPMLPVYQYSFEEVSFACGALTTNAKTKCYGKSKIIN